METQHEYSTRSRPCGELAEIAIRMAEKYGTPLEDVLPGPIALAVEAIIQDLNDRRGIKHAWREIDEDVRDEIKYVWGLIIEQCTGAQE